MKLPRRLYSIVLSFLLAAGCLMLFLVHDFPGILSKENKENFREEEEEDGGENEDESVSDNEENDNEEDNNSDNEE